MNQLHKIIPFFIAAFFFFPSLFAYDLKEDLEDQFKALGDIISREKDEISSLKDELIRLKRDRKNATARIEALEEQAGELDEAKEEIRDLKRQLREKPKEKVVYKVPEETAAKIDHLKKELTTKMGTINTLEKDIDYLRQELAAKSELKEQAGELDEAKEEIRDLKRQLREKPKEKVVYKVPEETAAKIDHLKKELTTKMGTINTLEKDIDYLRQELAAKSEQSTKARMAAETSGKTTKDLEERLDSAYKQIDTLKEKLAEQVSTKGADEKIVYLRKELLEKETVINALTSKVDYLMQDVAHKQEQLAKQESSGSGEDKERIEDLAGQLDRAEQEIEMLKEKLAGSSGNELPSNVTALRGEIEKKDQEIQYLKGIIQEAIEKIRLLSKPY